MVALYKFPMISLTADVCRAPRPLRGGQVRGLVGVAQPDEQGLGRLPRIARRLRRLGDEGGRHLQDRGGKAGGELGVHRHAALPQVTRTRRAQKNATFELFRRSIDRFVASMIIVR